MGKPKVSVIVTAYNCAKELPRCLDALINQSLKEIEIICVDDASSDGTTDVVKEYEEKDARVIGVINFENVGASEARNLGLEKASAPYIMFCDGDDYYDRQMCEKMLKKMEDMKPKVGMVISEIRVEYLAHAEMRISDENYYNLHFSGYQVVNEEVLTETDFAPTNKLFRKDLIDKYNLRFPKGLHYEDAYFCAAYICVCKTIYYLNEQLYTYVRRPSSIMSNTWSRTEGRDTSIDHIYIAFKLFDFLEENNMLEKYNGAFWKLFVSYERLSMNYSRSQENTDKVRKEVHAFIEKHGDKFSQVPLEVQAQIKQMTAQKFAPTKNRAKQLVMRFLPTYKLQVQNVLRLRALRQKNQRLIEEVERMEQKD